MQEVTQDVFNKIKAELEKNGYVGSYCPHNKLHGVAIFYKKNRFQQLQEFNGQFKTQKTDKEGNKLFFSDGTPNTKRRRHLILDLKDLMSQKVTRIASCHFEDPRSLELRSAHVSQVLQTMNSQPKNYQIDYSVIAGDFNQDQWGDKGIERLTQPSLKAATALKPLFNSGYKVGASLKPTEFRKKDKQNYNSQIVPLDRKIDHIFIKTSKKGWLFDLDVLTFDLRGSDHKAVAAGILYK